MLFLVRYDNLVAEVRKSPNKRTHASPKMPTGTRKK